MSVEDVGEVYNENWDVIERHLVGDRLTPGTVGPAGLPVLSPEHSRALGRKIRRAAELQTRRQVGDEAWSTFCRWQDRDINRGGRWLRERDKAIADAG